MSILFPLPQHHCLFSVAVLLVSRAEHHRQCEESTTNRELGILVSEDQPPNVLMLRLHDSLSHKLAPGL